MERNDFLELANQQIGKSSAEQLKWYGAATGTPSCMIGVSWLFAMRDAIGQIGGKWAYVPYFVNWAKANGIWVSKPEPGYIVVFDWTGNKVGSHIGIVEKVNADGSFVTIELNAGDRQKWERLSRKSYVLGFAKVAFDVKAEVTSKPEEAPDIPPIDPPRVDEFKKGAMVMILPEAKRDIVNGRLYLPFVYRRPYILMEDPASDGTVAFSPTGNKPATGRNHIGHMKLV